MEISFGNCGVLLEVLDPQFPNGISGKLPYHLISNRNFRIFWPNGKHPWAILSPLISTQNLLILLWVLTEGSAEGPKAKLDDWT